MMESMVLAEAIYRSRSQRLLRVLSASAVLLLAGAVWVAVDGEQTPTAEVLPLQDCELETTPPIRPA
jgi:hypothetical protein